MEKTSLQGEGANEAKRVAEMRDNTHTRTHIMCDPAMLPGYWGL